MPRRYVRRRYARASRPLKTVKYSSETFSSGANIPKYIQPAQGDPVVPPYSINLVAPISSQGMRKAKNFSLVITSNSDVPIVWALVYLPQGQLLSDLRLGDIPESASLYEPNQNVIMSGVASTQRQQPVTRTRLARNLNSGDSVVLVFKQLVPYPTGTPAGTYTFYASLNYAITY